MKTLFDRMDFDCINVTREHIKELVRELCCSCHILEHFLSNVNPQIHPNHLSWLKEARELKKEKENRPRGETTTEERQFVNMYVSTKSD